MNSLTNSVTKRVYKKTNLIKQVLSLVFLLVQGVAFLGAMVPEDNHPQKDLYSSESCREQEECQQDSKKEKRRHSTEDIVQDNMRLSIRRRLNEIEQERSQVNQPEPKTAFFSDENSFFLLAQTIARDPRNLTDKEHLKLSVNAIRALLLINKNYRTYLYDLLKSYSHGDNDQAPLGIKIMRYILSEQKPELREALLSLNSFHDAHSFIELASTIHALSDNDIIQGNLVEEHTALGQLYVAILIHENRSAISYFFKKIKTSLGNNPEVLRKKMTYVDALTGETALITAATYNNLDVTRALIQSLQDAYSTNRAGLYNALVHQDHEGMSALMWAIDNNQDNHNHADVVRTIVQSLQRACENNQETLQQALMQQDDNRMTALLFAACHQNQEVIALLITALKEAFGSDKALLLQALTLQDDFGHSAVDIAIMSNNHAAAVTIQRAINEAAVDLRLQGQQ